MNLRDKQDINSIEHVEVNAFWIRRGMCEIHDYIE